MSMYNTCMSMHAVCHMPFNIYQFTIPVQAKGIISQGKGIKFHHPVYLWCVHVTCTMMGKVRVGFSSYGQIDCQYASNVGVANGTTYTQY